MFEQNIYQMVDQNNGKEIKQVLDTENNKVIWERAIPTYDTPIVPTRNASLLEVSIDGICTQDGTPAPDNYVPIMCNNGVVGMVDDELPSGYTRLSYIESDGTSGDSGSNGYVDTEIFINSIDTDVEIDFQLTDTYAPSPRMAWGYMGTPSSLPRWGFGAYGGRWLGSPNATAGAGEVDTRRHVAVMRVYNGGSNTSFYSGTLDGEALYEANNLGNVSIFEGNDIWSVYLFARNNNNTAANFVACKIFRFKVYKSDTLTHDLVPCKNGNGALGFYDLVTATFSVASGTLIAGAADYSHSHIGVVGTLEALAVIQNQNTDPTIVNVTLASGTTSVQWNSNSSCIVAPIKPNTVYTIGFLTKPTSGSIFRAATTRTKVTSSATSAATIAYDLDKNDYEPKTFNSGAEAAWMYVQLSNTMTADDFASILIQEGTSLMPPQTASVPDLYAVSTYTDEADIISGGITRKVGIKVLDGTETTWALSDSGTTHRFRGVKPRDCYTPASRAPSICTHFKYVSTGSAVGGMFIGASQYWYFIPTDQTMDTVEAWKAWLAEQYAAGIPVIVIYPLAEEVTESIISQDIQGYRGKTMVATAQSQYVSGQNIKVKYLGIDSGAISGEMEVPGGDLP